MKKWTALVSLALCAGLLSACGAPAGGNTTSGGPPAEPDPNGVNTADPAAAAMVCRIVSGAEDGDLLLARQDGAGGDVYRLSTEGLQVFVGGGSAGAEDLRDGMLVEVRYDGNILETFPARFANAAALHEVSEADFDDLCVLYRTVLNDLWEVDSGLNSDLTELGVDLSATRLSESEQAAVAWAFGEDHGLTPIQGTYEELVEQGYITGTPLEGTDAKFCQWENGCLFSITEREAEGQFSLTPLAFDAEKWRSGLGAYYFMDCSSLRTAAGHWDGYAVGAEAIS